MHQEITALNSMLGEPFRFSTKFSYRHVCSGGISINLEQVVSNFSIHSNCAKDTSSWVICHITVSSAYGKELTLKCNKGEVARANIIGHFGVEINEFQSLWYLLKLLQKSKVSEFVCSLKYQKSPCWHNQGI